MMRPESSENQKSRLSLNRVLMLPVAMPIPRRIRPVSPRSTAIGLNGVADPVFSKYHSCCRMQDRSFPAEAQPAVSQ